jgi:hypothetical protein
MENLCIKSQIRVNFCYENPSKLLALVSQRRICEQKGVFVFDRRREKGRDRKNVMIVILLTVSVPKFQHFRIHNIDGCAGGVSDDLVEYI